MKQIYFPFGVSYHNRFFLFMLTFVFKYQQNLNFQASMKDM